MTRVFAIQLCVHFLFLSSPVPIAANGNEDSLLEEQVERAARVFRLQVYETFRTDRAEYDHRSAEAQRILEDWRRRGAADLEVPSLLQWFRDATLASRRNPQPSLPAYRPPGEPGPVTRIPSFAAPTPPSASPPFPTPEVRPLPRHTDARRFVPDESPLPNLDRNQKLPELHGPEVVVTPPTSSDVADHNRPAMRDQPSPVDLAVLGSRIRAFNLTLSEIETELSQPGAWPVERLTGMINQIERLFGRRHVSQIYYDSLTTEQQQRILDFASVDLTLALLDQRLFEAQVALMDANLELDPADGKHELNQLRSLSEKVKNWTVLRD